MANWNRCAAEDSLTYDSGTLLRVEDSFTIYTVNKRKSEVTTFLNQKLQFGMMQYNSMVVWATKRTCISAAVSQ